MDNGMLVLAPTEQAGEPHVKVPRLSAPSDGGRSDSEPSPRASLRIQQNSAPFSATGVRTGARWKGLLLEGTGPVGTQAHEAGERPHPADQRSSGRGG